MTITKAECESLAATVAAQADDLVDGLRAALADVDGGWGVRTVAEIEADLRQVACSDGNCRVLRPSGMHTNGGCRCVRNLRERDSAAMLDRVLSLHNERALAIRTEERDAALATSAGAGLLEEVGQLRRVREVIEAEIEDIDQGIGTYDQRTCSRGFAALAKLRAALADVDGGGV